MDEPFYKVGLSDRELTLLLMLIDDEPTSDVRDSIAGWIPCE